MTKSHNRIVTLDLMRGYFLIVILIDHLARFPGILDAFTGRGWLWASAAEGFFIVSGLMVGLVRGREARTGSFHSVWRKLWRRSLELYAWSVTLTLVFTLAAHFLVGRAGLKAGLETVATPTLLWRTLTLQYIYGWADFLPYYAVFMLVAPAAVYLTKQRAGWVVALLSVVVWLGRGQNFYLAWQILFFGGILVGYYLADVEARLLALSARAKTAWLTGLYGMAGLTLIVSNAIIYLKSWSVLGIIGVSLQRFATISEPWFDKWSLAPGRLIIAILWFTASYVLVRSREQAFTNRLGKLLLPLGRNCLFVYGVESFVVFSAWILWPSPLGLAANFAINLGAIGLIWVSAWLLAASKQQNYQAGFFGYLAKKALEY